MIKEKQATKKTVSSGYVWRPLGYPGNSWAFELE